MRVVVGAFIDTPCGREGSEDLTGLSPRRFSGLTRPLAVRVVVGGCAASLYKTFVIALAGGENAAPPLVAGATTFPPLKRGHYGYSAVCYMTLQGSIERLILPPE